MRKTNLLDMRTVNLQLNTDLRETKASDKLATLQHERGHVQTSYLSKKRDD